jgi:hypothetical protein
MEVSGELYAPAPATPDNEARAPGSSGYSALYVITDNDGDALKHFIASVFE